MSQAPPTHDAFLGSFQHLFEHSPWVVERAWWLGPFADTDAVHAAFLAVIDKASPEERLQLVRAHPRLADRAAIAAGLTADSASEQAGAGLDRLSPGEYETFHALNTAYEARFGFPFVICVRLHDRASILTAMQARLESDTSSELIEALKQVSLIARLRLDDALGAT